MVLGIVANPVYHSKGPLLHNAALQKCGVDGVYVPFLVENFEDFLRVYNAPDFHGFRFEGSISLETCSLNSLILCVAFCSPALCQANYVHVPFKESGSAWKKVKDQLMTRYFLQTASKGS